MTSGASEKLRLMVAVARLAVLHVPHDSGLLHPCEQNRVPWRCARSADGSVTVRLMMIAQVDASPTPPSG